MNRRQFMGYTMASGGLLTSLEALLNEDKAPFQFENKLSLKVLGTSWGYSGSVDSFCAAVKNEGYDGIEMWWPGSADQKSELFAALKKHDLEIGFLCGAGDADYQTHLAAFKKAVSEATSQFDSRPLYINCHSGKDYFSFDQNQAIVEYTLDASAKSGIPIYHETHRSRMLFAAHIAKQFLEKNPGMRITLDLSHWCNVHESLLADQQEAVQLALSRTGHIHARVGHAESPQVSDPRAPEWAEALNAHLAWWDTVVAYKVNPHCSKGSKMTS